MAEVQDPVPGLPDSTTFKTLPASCGLGSPASGSLGPGPRREQLQKLPWAWTAARPGLLGVVPPPREPALFSLLPASACRVDSEDRSGQYSCIFLPEHAMPLMHAGKNCLMKVHLFPNILSNIQSVTQDLHELLNQKSSEVLGQPRQEEWMFMQKA